MKKKRYNPKVQVYSSLGSTAFNRSIRDWNNRELLGAQARILTMGVMRRAI